MSYWRPILYSLILTILFLIPQTYASLTNSNFTSVDHMKMGNEVELHFSLDDPGQHGQHFTLHNGLRVSYGDIISMGDLYGVPGKPVSAKHRTSKRKARFMAAFNLFATNKEGLEEAQQIQHVIHDGSKVIAAEREKGHTSDEIYKKISDDFDRRLNCITGGGCSASTWWIKPGRYLKLVYDNFDHFGENAWITYQIGHQIAINKAIAAHKTGDLDSLQLAYAINAFASHFLADRFSAAHLRVPRRALPRLLNPGILGSILANYMHNEENSYGIHVRNQMGQHWIAYGDSAFVEPASSEHRQILQQILQTSADQVFAAFKTGVEPTDDIVKYLPEVDETSADAKNDIAPMFSWDTKHKKLLRRVNLSDPYDRRMTSDWWGWSTVYELRDKNGLAATDQAILALSNYSHQAIHHGLITDKDMLDYLYHSAS